MDDLAVLLTDDPLPDVDKFAREIDGGFNGTLNEANLASVARLMTRIFEGRKVAIATCHYCDRGIDNRVKLVTDQEFYADWCDGKNDIIRYHHIGDKCEYDSEPYKFANLTFLAGGFIWFLDAAPGNSHDHDDYRYSYVSFGHERSVPSMQYINRAPGGDVHKHMFTVQGMFDG